MYMLMKDTTNSKSTDQNNQKKILVHKQNNLLTYTECMRIKSYAKKTF